MKSKMMKLTTKVTAAIMVASALATSASPALVKADDSVVIMESVGTEEAAVENEVVEEVVTQEPVVEEVVTVEPVVDETVMEAPVVEEVVTVEPVVDEIVMEAPVVEEVVTEEPVAEEVVTEEDAATEDAVVTEDAAVTEEVVDEETVEKVALVEFVDEGYKKVEVDPETESVVAEVERNFREASGDSNRGGNDFSVFWTSPGSDYMLMDSVQEMSTLEEVEKEKAEAVEKDDNDNKKDDKEEEIRKVGTIAGNFAVKMSDIDFEKDNAIEQATMLTFQTINENVISNIPYVGGFLSTILESVFSGGSAEEKKSDPTSEEMQQIKEQLIAIEATIQRATEKQMDATEIQTFKNNYGKVEEAAKLLQEKYYYHNNEYIAAIENLNNSGHPSYEYATQTFKGIYDVDEQKKPYFDAYMNFLDLAIDNKVLLPGVNSADIFETYDLINSIGKKENTKYMFNTERELLTDRVANSIDAGYSIIRFCMEVELAKRMNMREAGEIMRKKLEGDICEKGKGGRMGELISQEEELKEEYKALSEDFEKSTDAEEKKIINEKINAINEKMTAINDEKASINDKLTEISTIDAQCSGAIKKITTDTELLNAKKDKANEVISNQRKSILEGYEYLAENADQKEEINVYFDKVKALEFKHNGKTVIAYPKFYGGASRVEYVDKYGNLWAHQDVSYGDAGKKLDTGSKVLFGFYSLATSINPNLVGEKAVIYEKLEIRGGLAHRVTVLYDGMENKQSVRVPMDWVYSIRSYQLKEITNEF